METAVSFRFCPDCNILGNFLVEWKLPPGYRLPMHRGSLGNFLVEWKPKYLAKGSDVEGPWKLPSGMETNTH